MFLAQSSELYKLILKYDQQRVNFPFPSEYKSELTTDNGLVWNIKLQYLYEDS